MAADGTVTVLKDGIALETGEIMDSSFMSKKALVSFLAEQVAEAREQRVLFSLHMKATMMKVSDPIIFGYGVEAYFADLFAKHGATFDKLGVDVRNGFGDLVGRLGALDAATRAAIEADIPATYDAGPDIAMVDSDRGITNLHVPSDVIIDASMPAMLRTSGCMWNKLGKTQDTKAVIPDSSYSGVYQVVMEDCKANGAYDPHDGLGAQRGPHGKKAEEYGSHDKTFEVSGDGVMRVVDAAGNVLMAHRVEAGDIWRACQVKDAPVQDWVGLAVRRAQATGAPAVFWLDQTRAHDRNLINKVQVYLGDHDTSGLELHIMSPVDATRFSVERIRRGEDTISVTGNVLRDYLTDLFPILEVGTSAKMLSIVPLMNGGGLFETGAGGSAPKHVQQFEKEITFAGTALVSSWPWRSRFSTSPTALAWSRRGFSGRHSMKRPPGTSSRTSPRRARSTSSTTAAATSGWPCSGHRLSQVRAPMVLWLSPSDRSPPSSPMPPTPSCRSSTLRRARRWTWVDTSAPMPPRCRPRCARAPRSTASSTASESTPGHRTPHGVGRWPDRRFMPTCSPGSGFGLRRSACLVPRF